MRATSPASRGTASPPCSGRDPPARRLLIRRRTQPSRLAGEPKSTLAAAVKPQPERAEAKEPVNGTGSKDAPAGDLNGDLSGLSKERLVKAMEKTGWVQAMAVRILGPTPCELGYALKKHSAFEMKKRY